MQGSSWPYKGEAVFGPPIFAPCEAQRVAFLPQVSLSGPSGIDAFAIHFEPFTYFFELGYRSRVKTPHPIRAPPTIKLPPLAVASIKLSTIHFDPLYFSGPLS